MSHDAVTALPMLRQDLVLRAADKNTAASCGAGQAHGWLLFDPIKNCYHRLGTSAMKLMRFWATGDAQNILEQINTHYPDEPPVTEAELEDFLAFTIQNHLTVMPPQDDPKILYQQERAANPQWWKQLAHRYLFFRIPLISPDRFLALCYPLVRPLFSRLAWCVIAVLAVLGLFLVSRQWDVFVQTFMQFLSFEGLFYYGTAIIVLMSLHELGHAFAAHHLKVRVTTIGIAFLVMFPILYTDTTDAWRLSRRSDRLLIDIGGIAIEILVAVIATWLWIILPDGSARSIAFFAATTSWAMSLFVNLNPLMRFDGYYILSDLCDMANLQSRSFAVGRWHLRSLVLGIGNDKGTIGEKPEDFSRRQTAALIGFAWATWVYRFFLFLGIALFVHAFFARALGIILFIVEIAWFIARPIRDELSIWFSMRKEVSVPRQSVMLILGVGVVLMLFLPLGKTVHAPGVVTPALHTQIHAGSPGQIAAIHVRDGDMVKRGDLLFEIKLPDIEAELLQSQTRLLLLNQKLDRRAGDREDRTQSEILKQSKASELQRLRGLRQQIADATIVAGHDGRVVAVSPDLHVGQWVNSEERLARLLGGDHWQVTALTVERDVARLAVGGRMKFIPDDILRRRLDMEITSVSHQGKSIIEDPALSSTHGGRVAVRVDPDGNDVPDRAMFEVRAMLATDDAAGKKAGEDHAQTLRAVTGVAIMEAEPQSLGQVMWQRFWGVMIREFDF